MKTADSKTAEAKVRLQRTIFDEQMSEQVRKEDQARLLEPLSEEQRDALAALGGVETLRKAAAFLTAGMGAEPPVTLFRRARNLPANSHIEIQ